MQAKVIQISERKSSGQSIAELPVAIFFFILVLLLPMADLATFALRATNVFAAARNAAHLAGRSNSFRDAVANARARVLQSNGMSLAGVEIKDSDVHVYIVGSPLKAGKDPIRQEKALLEADPKSYLYQMEVVVSAKVQPLFTLSPELFGKIPGLTDAFTIQTSNREYCERPRNFTIKA